MTSSSQSTVTLQTEGSSSAVDLLEVNFTDLSRDDLLKYCGLLKSQLEQVIKERTELEHTTEQLRFDLEVFNCNVL